MPVFPLVASRIVLPRRNLPLRSPANIIASAARSFTDPPGFKCSALTSTSTPEGKLRVTLRRRISGVFPMFDSIESSATGCLSSLNWAQTMFSSDLFWSALTCQRFSWSRPVATCIRQIQNRPRFLCRVRDRLLKTLAALGYLHHLLFTPAKAFPIASRTTGATGAMTAAVIVSVVHDCS